MQTSSALIRPISVPPHDPALPSKASARGELAAAAGTQPSELREKFDAFVGETFFGQMLKAMRKTVGKPAYFHGGRGEEVFQGQLDQMLAEQMTKAGASQFTGPMFELFNLSRS